MTTIHVVLPIYNEAQSLPALFENLDKYLKELEAKGYKSRYVLCDDGSRDDSAKIIKEHGEVWPTKIVTHETNKGLGTTLRDGLWAALEDAKEEDIVVTMDADNTHPADLMLPMEKEIKAGADVVIASRYREGADVVGLSAFRKFMSWGARVCFQLVFPIPGLRDYTCGYRMYRVSLLKKAFAHYGKDFIEYSGFHAMADVLLRLARFGPKIAEVPMVLRYDLKGGASKMAVGSTVLKTLQMMLKRRFFDK